ncbi:hypothetical protein NOM01_10955 [Sporolactobacillus sp. STSJ-5]|uniref:hypothetical protein n=1 Tax=Sporolactobacillus sp. STSJ-5 TaxID=2965076 RepID=UPI0021052238|nr:hypothetical protein [Sporolactobacillus sp. STSJ-5]MCQ2010534.1 hypothetical protein [Sporolactobacillus sp. STSJ-5]
MSKYLTINQDGSFGFKDDDINQISDSDVNISDDIYNQFFQNQAEGKQYEIKNTAGTTFDDIFEEYIPESAIPTPTTEQQQIAQLLLITAQQAQQIAALQEASTNG